MKLAGKEVAKYLEMPNDWELQLVEDLQHSSTILTWVPKVIKLEKLPESKLEDVLDAYLEKRGLL